MRPAPATAAPGSGGVDGCTVISRVRGTVLAFDYGARRTGVAAGDAATAICGAVTTVPTARLDAMDALVTEWRPAALVVGLPLGADGGETAMCNRARAFGAALKKRHRLPLFFVDETLSSRAAGRRAKNAKNRKEKRHATAAALILETFFTIKAQQKNER
ncbi:MAG: Holliday junction resolvase RuvX [Gammaproteobacteria bacterium]|nr:Holliday junction resolvase RuvX [Gammaproteobacteria bacterium]